MPDLTGLLGGFMNAQNMVQQQQANQLNIQRGQMENKAMAQQQASTDAQSGYLADALKQQAAENAKAKQQGAQQQQQQQSPDFQLTQLTNQYSAAATRAAQKGDATSAAALAGKANDIQALLAKRQQAAATLQRTQQATQLETQKAEHERMQAGADAFAPLVEGTIAPTQENYEVALRQAYGNDLPAGVTGDVNADMPFIQELVKSSAGFREFQRDQRAAQHQAGKGEEHDEKLQVADEKRKEENAKFIETKLVAQRKPVEAFDQKLQTASALVTAAMGRQLRPDTTLGFRTDSGLHAFQQQNSAAYQQLSAVLGNLTGSIRSGKYSAEQANKIGGLVDRGVATLNRWYSGEADDKTLRQIGEMVDGLRNNVVEPQYTAITLRGMAEARRLKTPEYMVDGAGATPATAIHAPTTQEDFDAAVNAGVKYFIGPDGKVHSLKAER